MAIENSSTRDNSKKQTIPDAPPPAVVATAPERLKAEVQDETPAVATQADAMSVLGKVIGDAVAAGMAHAAPRRKVSLAEYDPKTTFHPDKTKVPELTRNCFQNGSLMQPHSMFDEEIRLLNSLTHSGRYIKRIVEVVIVPNGSEDEVHLRYNNKTNDQRNALAREVNAAGEPSVLCALLRSIANEQAKEREEDERVNAVRGARPRR